MNLNEVEAMSRSGRSMSWFRDLAGFAATLRGAVSTPGKLFLLGTPDDEPWHLTAHLDTLARWRGVPELTPTLVRWRPPPNPAAPGVRVDDLEGGAGQTIFVVTRAAAGDRVLERLDDLKRRGSTIFGMAESANSQLGEVAHEIYTVPSNADLQRGPLRLACDFEAASHLVGLSAVAPSRPQPRWRSTVRALTG